nr:hypothetical protein [Actinomadura soli]
MRSSEVNADRIALRVKPASCSTLMPSPAATAYSCPIVVLSWTGLSVASVTAAPASTSRGSGRSASSGRTPK